MLSQEYLEYLKFGMVFFVAVFGVGFLCYGFSRIGFDENRTRFVFTVGGMLAMGLCLAWFATHEVTTNEYERIAEDTEMAHRNSFNEYIDLVSKYMADNKINILEYRVLEQVFENHQKYASQMLHRQDVLNQKSELEDIKKRITNNP